MAIKGFATLPAPDKLSRIRKGPDGAFPPAKAEALITSVYPSGTNTRGGSSGRCSRCSKGLGAFAIVDRTKIDGWQTISQPIEPKLAA